MFLTRAERDHIRARRRRRLAMLLTATLTLIVWASAQHGHPRPGAPAHAHHSARPRHAPAASRHRAPALTPGPDLAWSGYHGIALPTSRTDGPHHIHNGLAWGFTRTPGGALLAAVNIAVRTAAQWGPAIYQQTIHRQVTGPDTKALLHADASEYAALRAAAHVRRSRPAGPVYASIPAYRFVAYTRATATVDVVSEAPGSSGQVVMAATRVEVRWQQGDWRVVAPPGGDWANSATPLSSLTGYTPFPNQR